MGFNKYYHVTRTGLANILAYVDDYFVSAIFMGVLIFVFVQLWKTVFLTRELVVGFTLPMMVWYLVMTETVMFSPIIPKNIGDEVKKGTIAYSLNKPYNYVFYKYADYLSHLFLKNSIIFITGAIIAYFSVGGFGFSVSFLIPVLIVFFLAVTIHFIIAMIIGITAFWYEDTWGLEIIYHKFIFVFGGMLFPLTILPDFIYNVIKYLPFTTIAYYPGKMFVDPSWSFFQSAILFQGIWLVVLVTVLFVMYKRALRKVNINGG